MIFTEPMLEIYSQPLGAKENEQCKRAIRMIRDALGALSFTDDNKGITPLYPDTLAYSIQMRSMDSSRKIRILLQGSYANNTNVRAESDVDIAVIEESIFETGYRQGVTNANYNFTSASASPKVFKNEVQKALTLKFGDDVKRGDKSVKVHGNTYRKDADTVPCRRYRDYRNRNDYNNDVSNFIGGIVIYPDSGGKIVNYPEQHIFNGLKKNKATKRYFKKMVRIIKKMRYLMADKGIKSAGNVGSFVLESLLWNIADSWYLRNCINYRKVFAFHLLIKQLVVDKQYFMVWKEANGIKPLCSGEGSYNRLCRFINDLSHFYKYK